MDMVPGEYQDSVKIGEQHLDSESQPEGLSGQNKKALRESLHEGLSLGEPAGARTQDTRIKSPVLYLLSYGLSSFAFCPAGTNTKA